jgi:benzylsuccinate CoA-transferase BbsF subunit
MPNRPLEGIKIVSFTWFIAGPVTARVLANYGAEVVRIEAKSKIDIHRIQTPYKDNIPGVNRSGQFNQDNTGVLSVALNIAKPRGLEIAKKFVARADIVIENFAGGVMKRIGLGYEELKKLRPDIIMLSTCMQGQTGPHANYPGFGQHLAALSGFYQITGWPDRKPTGPDGPYTDFIAPCFNIFTILAALDYRRRTGKGQYIDMSQYENAMHFMAPILLDYSVNQRVASRMGNHSAYSAPHCVYRCRGTDRWCAIAISTDEEWSDFCRVLGNPAWASDPKFSFFLNRKQNEEEMDRLVEAWTVNHSPEEIMTILQANGVPAGVVQTGEDLLEHDPQLKHRHACWELDHPEIGKYHAPGSAFKLSRSSSELKRAPLLGEHNEYALKTLLGMPDEDVADLLADGVLETS